MSAFDNYKRYFDGMNGRYEYIKTSDDIYTRWMKQREDLNYALKVERSRDRFVANRKGLEEAIRKAINKILLEEMDAFADMVANDIIVSVNNAIGGIVSGNIKGTKKSYKMDLLDAIAKGMGRAMVEAPIKIAEEMMKDNNRY